MAKANKNQATAPQQGRGLQILRKILQLLSVALSGLSAVAGSDTARSIVSGLFSLSESAAPIFAIISSVLGAVGIFAGAIGKKVAYVGSHTTLEDLKQDLLAKLDLAKTALTQSSIDADGKQAFLAQIQDCEMGLKSAPQPKAWKLVYVIFLLLALAALVASPLSIVFSGPSYLPGLLSLLGNGFALMGARITSHRLRKMRSALEGLQRMVDKTAGRIEAVSAMHTNAPSAQAAPSPASEASVLLAARYGIERGSAPMLVNLLASSGYLNESARRASPELASSPQANASPASSTSSVSSVVGGSPALETPPMRPSVGSIRRIQLEKLNERLAASGALRVEEASDDVAAAIPGSVDGRSALQRTASVVSASSVHLEGARTSVHSGPMSPSVAGYSPFFMRRFGSASSSREVSGRNLESTLPPLQPRQAF